MDSRDYAAREGASKRVTLRVPLDLIEWIEARADEEGRSVSAVIKRHLRRAMQETAAA